MSLRQQVTPVDYYMKLSCVYNWLYFVHFGIYCHLLDLNTFFVLFCFVFISRCDLAWDAFQMHLSPLSCFWTSHQCAGLCNPSGAIIYCLKNVLGDEKLKNDV